MLGKYFISIEISYIIMKYLCNKNINSFLKILTKPFEMLPELAHSFYTYIFRRTEMAQTTLICWRWEIFYNP